MKSLVEIIRRRYGCKAIYLRTESVSEHFGPDVVWAGVHVYELIGEVDGAGVAYAWYREILGGETVPVSIVPSHPVESAVGAVRLATRA